ncbi:hypothetical protein Tco_1515840 [Tanacetum coccineum]
MQVLQKLTYSAGTPHRCFVRKKMEEVELIVVHSAVKFLKKMIYQARYLSQAETGIFVRHLMMRRGVITDFKTVLPTEIDKVQNKSGAHALLSHIHKQQRNNHKDQHHCLFACFLSQEELWNSIEALQDDRWVIGTKWVYKTKEMKRCGGCEEIKQDLWRTKRYTQERSIQMSSMGELYFFLRSTSQAGQGRNLYLSGQGNSRFLFMLSRNFKYLKEKTNLGMVSRESPFDLEAFLDSDMGVTGPIVATSNNEADVDACNIAVDKLFMGYKINCGTMSFTFDVYKIHIDNESTICIVKNTDALSVEIIDLLTKPFDGPRFNYLVVSIGIAWMKGRNAKSGSAIVNTDRYALTTNPTIYDSLIKQFWQTATANTNADGTLEIKATIDTIRYTISEASIRDSLQLEDATGITMLPNDELFEGMGQIGYPTDGTFTFWKSFFTPQWRYLVHHLLHCISSKSGGWDQFGSNIATALVCLSTGRVYNFSKLIFDGMVANLKSKTKFLMYPRFLQMILNIQTENKHLYLAVSLTKKIFGNMKRGFRGAPRPLLPSMLLVATNPNAGQEHDAVAPSQPSSSTPQVPSQPSTPTPPLIPTPTPTPPPIPTPTPIPDTEPTPFEHIYEEPSPVHHHFSPPQEQAPSQMPMDDLLHEVPKLISRIDSLEMDLKQTKLTMGNAIVKLVKKVKKLEGFLKRRNLVLSYSEEEEPETQRRKSQDDLLDSSVLGLVTPSSTRVNALGEEQVEDISPNTLEAAKTLSKVASLKTRSIDKGRRYKRRKEAKGKKVVSSLDFQEEVDAGAEQVNTASADQVSTTEGVNTGSIKFSTGNEQLSTSDEQLSTGNEQVSTVGAKKSTSDQDKGQREGKAPMISEETPKKSKEQVLQEEASLAEAIRLDTQQREEVAKQVHLDSLLAQRIAEEEELNEQQKKRKAQVQFEAQHYTNE